jgi:hypothetical protein
VNRLRIGENRTAINDHETTLLATLVEATATDNHSAILCLVPRLTHCPSTHLHLVSLRIKVKGPKCSSVAVEIVLRWPNTQSGREERLDGVTGRLQRSATLQFEINVTSTAVTRKVTRKLYTYMSCQSRCLYGPRPGAGRLGAVLITSLPQSAERQIWMSTTPSWAHTGAVRGYKKAPPKYLPSSSPSSFQPQRPTFRS